MTPTACSEIKMLAGILKAAAGHIAKETPSQGIILCTQAIHNSSQDVLGAAPRRTILLTFSSAAKTKNLLRFLCCWKIAESPNAVTLPDELQYEDRMEVLLQR